MFTPSAGFQLAIRTTGLRPVVVRRLGELRVRVEQNVARCGSSGSLHFEYARPSGRIGGTHQLGKPVAVAGSASQDQFSSGRDLQEPVVGEVPARSVRTE